MKIGFCFNVKHDGNEGLTAELDFDAPDTIDDQVKIIEGLGHTVTRIEADENIFEKLKEAKPNIDLVFNIAEGLYGDARECWVPMACEILKIPYTHSGPTTHAIKLNKDLAKLAVAGMGFNVPEKFPCEFPVIIKPNAEGSSIGVFDANVVSSQKELDDRIKMLRDKGLKGELLIERFIDGREFTVGLLGNGESLQVMPIIEQKFDMLPPDMKKIAGFELKWLVEDQLKDIHEAYDCPAKISDELSDTMNEISRKIYNGLGVRDCARIDYRLDGKNNLYFLEINTLPGMIPTEKVISYFPTMARVAGMGIEGLFARIIKEAQKRWYLE